MARSWDFAIANIRSRVYSFTPRACSRMTASSSSRTSWSSNTVSPRHSLILGLLSLPAFSAFAQQPIAFVPTQGVSLSGSLSVADGKASIGNNGSITAGDDTAHLTLARGGDLLVCTSTKVHLSKDTSAGDNSDPSADSALMIALDRGALETNYATG